MKIHMDGRAWTVEQNDAGTLAPEAGDGYCGLHFRPDGGGEGEGVEMRWIPRPARLTKGLAGRLFLLAGERLWRDGRDGALYRVVLEGGTWIGDEAPGDSPAGRVTVRFLDPTGSAATHYDLATPLGLAGQDDLARLLDRARPERHD